MQKLRFQWPCFQEVRAVVSMKLTKSPAELIKEIQWSPPDALHVSLALHKQEEAKHTRPKKKSPFLLQCLYSQRLALCQRVRKKCSSITNRTMKGRFEAKRQYIYNGHNLINQYPNEQTSNTFTFTEVIKIPPCTIWKNMSLLENV